MRVKTGVVRHRKHKKIKTQAKGFRGHRGRTFQGAAEGVLHAQSHAYAGRKQKKRVMRRLWITRLNAALRNLGLSYSQFINILKKEDVSVNRKILSQIAMNYPETFEKIVNNVTHEANTD